MQEPKLTMAEFVIDGNEQFVASLPALRAQPFVDKRSGARVTEAARPGGGATIKGAEYDVALHGKAAVRFKAFDNLDNIGVYATILTARCRHVFDGLTRKFLDAAYWSRFVVPARAATNGYQKTESNNYAPHVCQCEVSGGSSQLEGCYQHG